MASVDANNPEPNPENERVTASSTKEDAPAEQPLEVDDFGLPIKRSKRPAYEEDDDDPAPTSTDAATVPIHDNDVVDAGNPDDADSSAPAHTNAPDAQPETSESAQKEPLSAKEPEEEPSSAKEPEEEPPNVTESPKTRRFSRHTQKSSVGTTSEWSHQQMAPQEDVEEEESEGEGDWQEMPALATHRIYDDWGKVLAKEYGEVEDETVAYGNLGGAGKGYTRVQIDEDAQSATSMDDQTAYLFKDQYASNTLDEEDEEGRDVVSQMQTTKELLTEGQRIAYVGVVRLAIVQMIAELERLDKSKASKKFIEITLDAMRMWGQKMMIRLYAHMDIDSQEQVMVEQLAEHGVLAADLTPTLMQNARVKNPEAPGSGVSSPAIGSRPSINSPRPASHNDERGASTTSLSLPGPNGTETPPPAYQEIDANDLAVQNPSDLVGATNIDLDLRWTVLCDLFLLLVAESVYDARSRTLLERVGAALSVEWQDICRFEKRVTDALEMQEQADRENWNEDEHLKAREKAARKKRLMVMGLCTVGGGLVIGLSAGMLAPVIGAGLAAGFTGIGVAGTGTFLGGTGAAALIGTTGTLIGSHIGMKTSHRRTGAVKTFEYRPLYNNKRVNLIVTVAGWMTGKVDDVRLPFSTVDPIMGDMYSINWEPEMLQSTGQTVQILGTEALTQTIQQILGATFLSTLMAGLSLPLVLSKLSYLIDNPWTVSLARADATGLILADSLIDRNLGVRPITLVGFSLGSRVIFSCLKELAKRGALGIIQNVYMFGSPVVVKKDEWTRARAVVSGRFVNGYARSDWILAYLFRATAGGILRVAGLATVDIPGIENVDVTEDVPGHMAYRGMMPTLLYNVGWKVESVEFTEIEDPDPENHEKRQRELINEIEDVRRELEEQENQGKKKGFSAFFTRRKVARSQKKDWETYDERSARVLDGSDVAESERVATENSHVLFDVDAIRREALQLALQGGDIDEIKKHIQIREIESTLPALRVSMSPSASPINGASSHHGGSTPVSPLVGKLSSEASRPADAGLRPTFASTESSLSLSAESNRERPSLARNAATDPESATAVSHASNPSTPRHHWDDEEDFGKEGDISMSFE